LEVPFTLVLTGGVLRHPSPLLREALVERVNEAASGVHAIQSRFESATGALLLALDSMNILTDATLLEHLESTLPGPAFLQHKEEVQLSSLVRLGSTCWVTVG
jgi:hypothetical protein